MKVWTGTGTSGGLIDAAGARVDVFDRGFTLGEGVFETIKLTPAGPFALTRHLRRLERSAAIVGVATPDLDHVRMAVDAVVASELPAVGSLGRLRVTLTAGTGEPTLTVTAVPMDPWPEATTAVTVDWTRNERSPIAGAKSTSYAEMVVAQREAHRRGASEALLANTQGQLCEGTASNVFVVIAGDVLTPPASSGCLQGITRELVLEMVGGREAVLGMEVLKAADEVFLTSSTRDVHPVLSLDERRWEHVGPITARFRSAFADIGRHLDP